MPTSKANKVMHIARVQYTSISPFCLVILTGNLFLPIVMGVTHDVVEERQLCLSTKNEGVALSARWSFYNIKFSNFKIKS